MAEHTAIILFIEDELSLVREFPVVLKRRGYAVLVANQANEALRILRDTPRIDAAVMDLKFPVEDGGEIGLQEARGGTEAGLVLAEEFRKKFRRAPIIVWTGSIDPEIPPRVSALGNAQVIPKAWGPTPVLDVLDSALRGGKDVLASTWLAGGRASPAERDNGQDDGFCGEIKAVANQVQLACPEDGFAADAAHDLRELAVCLNQQCYRAVFALAGRNLELTLKRQARDNGVAFEDSWMVGKLIECLTDAGLPLDPSMKNIWNIINLHRIAGVHSKQSVPAPTRAQAHMVCHALLDTMKKVFRLAAG